MKMRPEERKAQILVAGLKLAVQFGYMNLTDRDLAREAKCSKSLVLHYFGSILTVRREILLEAILVENLAVIRQGWGMKAPEIKACPPEILKRVFND